MIKKIICLLAIIFLLPLYAENNGKKAYEKACITCHGVNGAGVEDAKISGPNLTILKDEYAREQFGLIMSGKRKGDGSANMLKVLNESKLSPAELNLALDYALQLKEAPAFHVGLGNPAKGKAKYDMICLHCHGAEGEGYANPALPAPRLAGQADFYIFNQIQNFKLGHRDSDSPAAQQMKAMSMTLTTDEDINNVAAFIRSLDKINRADLLNLTFKVYPGSWGKMPDLSKLTPSKEGNIDDGLVDIKVAELTDNYAMVFNGDLLVPKDGDYMFQMGSDDGSILYIDGKEIINNDGIHHVSQSKKNTVKLKKGIAKFELRYFEKTGQEGLEIIWKAKKSNEFKALSASAKTIMSVAKSATMPIEPNKQSGEAVLFRNFIKDASARSIGVGYPEGTHMVFDATNMNLALMWNGKFLDGGEMFKGRGTNFMEPQGEAVKIGKFTQVGLLENENTQWPDLNRNSNEIRKTDLRFNGYTLDKQRYPTFMYSLGEIHFEDFCKPIDSKGSGVKRHVTAKAANPTDKLWFKAAFDKITVENGFYVINNSFKIKAENAKLREFGKIHELIVPFKFNGNVAEIDLEYFFMGELK